MFDWHAGQLSLSCKIDENFRVTQNVRRFLCAQCDANLVLGRDFHAWLKDAEPETVSDVVVYLKSS